MSSNDHYHYPFVHGTHGITNNGTSINNNSVNWQVIDNNSFKDSNLHVKSDIIIKGKSLTDTLDKIEERLAILHPNLALEDKWDELKELGNKYRALEAEIIEKQKMWDILNK